MVKTGSTSGVYLLKNYLLRLHRLSTEYDFNPNYRPDPLSPLLRQHLFFLSNLILPFTCKLWLVIRLRI